MYRFGPPDVYVVTERTGDEVKYYPECDCGWNDTTFPWTYEQANQQALGHRTWHVDFD